jgi:hypothetical protein
VYNAAFEGHTHAARSAVELPLGEGQGGGGLAAGCRFALECLACRSAKRVLRVQSISEWAPRMIGPHVGGRFD